MVNVLIIPQGYGTLPEILDMIVNVVLSHEHVVNDGV